MHLPLYSRPPAVASKNHHLLRGLLLTKEPARGTGNQMAKGGMQLVLAWAEELMEILLVAYTGIF